MKTSRFFPIIISSLVLSGCTIGPLTIPDISNPFVTKSQSGPEISTDSNTPTVVADTNTTIDISAPQSSRTISVAPGQKVTFVNNGKIDLNLILTLERDIPITVTAGGLFAFNYNDQPNAKVSWNGITISIVSSGPVPTKSYRNESITPTP